eukprot:COSAG05_NODE_8432_length_704_cov_1.953719_2_plen_152_part_01
MDQNYGPKLDQAIGNVNHLAAEAIGNADFGCVYLPYYYTPKQLLVALGLARSSTREAYCMPACSRSHAAPATSTPSGDAKRTVRSLPGRGRAVCPLNCAQPMRRTLARGPAVLLSVLASAVADEYADGYPAYETQSFSLPCGSKHTGSDTKE